MQELFPIGCANRCVVAFLTNDADFLTDKYCGGCELKVRVNSKPSDSFFKKTSLKH